MHKVSLLKNTGFRENDLASVARISTGYDFTAPSVRSNADDKRLVCACFNAGHMSVFEFADVVYQIECPIYIARQLMRYRSLVTLKEALDVANRSLKTMKVSRRLELRTAHR